MANYIVNAYNNGGSGGSVNMRKGRGTNYDLVVRVPHGATVSGTKSGTWSYMTYGNYSGYMMSVYLDDAGSSTPSGNWVTRWTNTPGETVNIRSGAGTNYSIVKRLSHATKVEVNSPTATWSQVREYGSTSILGYIMTSFLTETNPSGGSGGGSTSNGLRAGHYVQVASNTVNVRAASSSSSKLRGVLFKGTKVYCSGIVNDSWVKIIWGGIGSSDAYVMAQYLVDGGVGHSSKLERASAIANSMLGDNYPYQDSIGNLGLSAEQWCVQYCSWLMKAAGCLNSNYPDFSNNATVSGAIGFFGNKYVRKELATPAKGNWVFYTTTGSQPSDPKHYYAHVGFVVDIKGNTLTTVEGNLNHTISSPGPYNYMTATHIGKNDFSVLGFATPNWN